MLVSRNKAFLMTLPKAWDPPQSPHLLPAWQLHQDLQVSLLQVLPSTICFCPQQYIFRRKLRGKLIVSLFHAYAISVAHGKVGAHCPVTTIPHHCPPSCTWASATGITYTCINRTPLWLPTALPFPGIPIVIIVWCYFSFPPAHAPKLVHPSRSYSSHLWLSSCFCLQRPSHLAANTPGLWPSSVSTLHSVISCVPQP